MFHLYMRFSAEHEINFTSFFRYERAISSDRVVAINLGHYISSQNQTIFMSAADAKIEIPVLLRSLKSSILS